MSNRGRHKKSKQHLIVQILGQTIANKMMHYQVVQGNKPDLDVFLHHPTVGICSGGFNWSDTTEGCLYWNNIIMYQLIPNPLYKKWILNTSVL